MRLLIVTQYFWPENFKINDLAYKLAQRGHQITVLTGFPEYPSRSFFKDFYHKPSLFANNKGINIIRIPTLSRGKSNVALFLNYLSFVISASSIGLLRLRSCKFDVIFSYLPSPITSSLPAILISKIKKVPLIFWVFDLWPESIKINNNSHPSFIFYLLIKLVVYIYKNSDLILAPSKGFVTYIKKITRTPVLFLPVWSNINSKIKSKISKRLIPLKTGSFDIMFTGNIGEAQDFPAILDAAELLKSHSNIRWLIVGNGRMFQIISDSIKKRHLENNIILCGHHPEEMMPAFFKLAKVLLVTLRNEPIFSVTVPGKLQSYFEAKKPVVGMINGECNRIILESKAGLTCPASDSRALATIILKMSKMSSKKLQSFGNNGFMHNQQEYNQAILIDKIEKFLKNATLKKFKHAEF